jgi:acetolactate synthase-1/2/3 large subunit
MRVADYIADFLSSFGVRNVYLLSGTGSIHLDDAFAHHRQITFTAARHEAAAVAMAEASAKLSGSVGVVVTTTGPGGSNAFPGVVEAWVDSVPVLVISGQVDSELCSTSKRSFGIQGFNIVDQVKGITKYAVRVDNPLEIRYHLEKACFLALAHRRGPVWIDIPADVQSFELRELELVGFRAPAQLTELSSNALEQTVALLEAATKPLIIIGQGIRQAGVIDKVKLLIEKLGIPVVASRMGQDILADSNPFYFNQAGLMGHAHTFAITKSADLILALGTSLSHSMLGPLGGHFSSEAQFISVNCDSDDLLRPEVSKFLGVKSDIESALDFFLARSFEHGSEWNKWLESCRIHKRKIRERKTAVSQEYLNTYRFIDFLDAASPPNAIYVSDAGGSYYVTGQGLKFEDGKREVTSGAFASMGMTLPLAIGAATSNPTRRVIAITGDGSIELNIQELKTISDNRLPIKLFVINNGGYASIRASQDASCGGRYTDSQDVLNFARVSDAFGLRFEKLTSYLGLEEKLLQIISSPEPYLVEVMCDPDQEIISFTNEELLF